MNSLEVLFTPADFMALAQRDLSHTCCVVLDVLRATSTMVTALANGAKEIVPVAEISEALAAREQLTDALLAGERSGVRIGPELTGGRGFDLGNSPREFTPQAVAGKTIVITTTNGTRALRACRSAQLVLAGSFLNLTATTEAVRRLNAPELLVVCSGTYEQASYEDVLGAGAICNALWSTFNQKAIADSARMAREIFLNARADLVGAMGRSRNGARLLSQPELRDDVAFCAKTDATPIIAEMDKDGRVRKRGS